MTRRFHHDIQGRFFGVPYDFRRPTAARVASRVFNPRAAMFTPKVWGLGWTLNLGRKGSWLLLSGMMLVALTLSWVG